MLRTGLRVRRRKRRKLGLVRAPTGKALIDCTSLDVGRPYLKTEMCRGSSRAAQFIWCFANRSPAQFGSPRSAYRVPGLPYSSSRRLAQGMPLARLIYVLADPVGCRNRESALRETRGVLPGTHGTIAIQGGPQGVCTPVI